MCKFFRHIPVKSDPVNGGNCWERCEQRGDGRMHAARLPRAAEKLGIASDVVARKTNQGLAASRRLLAWTAS